MRGKMPLVRNFLHNNMSILSLVGLTAILWIQNDLLLKAKMVLYSIGLILTGTLFWYFFRSRGPLPSP